jgi:hypothetical protein
MTMKYVPALLCIALLAAAPARAQPRLLGTPIAANVGARAPTAPAARPAPAYAEEVRQAARRTTALRLVVSVAERRLWMVQGQDTLFRTSVAVGTGALLSHEGRTWRFETPRGVRRVLARERNPVWTPPDWHYAELASDSGWALVRLERGRPARLPDGSTLHVRGERIERRLRGGGVELLPPDEEVIYGTTLFVPPLGTANRRIAGELGAYKLDLGGGYMLHGTPHRESIGQAATHGCLRLDDDAIAYLYRNVPLGTPVYIY